MSDTPLKNCLITQELLCTIADDFLNQLVVNVTMLDNEEIREAREVLLDCMARLLNTRAESQELSQLKGEYCEECNFPLSDCGTQAPDGTPTQDCKVCQFRELVVELKHELSEIIEQNNTLKEALSSILHRNNGTSGVIEHALECQRVKEKKFLAATMLSQQEKK